MTKVKITKAMGEVENLNVLSAFKVENNSYVILDAEKLGSMGLPIIYVTKLVNDKFEKINDTNEWQSTKNYLKGIINGTNFEYIGLPNELKADEVYYTPLTLPSEPSLELIKSRYVPTTTADTSTEEGASSIPSTPIETEPVSNIPEIPVVSAEPAPTVSNIPPIPEVPVTPVSDIPVVEQPSLVQPVENINPIPTPEIPSVPNIPVTNEIPPVAPASPVMPDNNVASNIAASTIPNVPPVPSVTPNADAYVATPVNSIPPVNPIPNPVSPEPINMPINTPVVNPIPSEPPMPTPQVEQPIPAPVPPLTEAPINEPINNPVPEPTFNFDNDRETFLKACENMFDALISKYQKQLSDLNEREKLIKQKETEIDQKLYNANEHLANAEAKEQVANIVHDNAQKVMDLNNFMPVNNTANPTNPTGVI
ncbi:MAG: hypothetical protein NC483_07445 [Ruminococcus sp.]|nr:hypothetical protein [Ruminococcus sp.]